MGTPKFLRYSIRRGLANITLGVSGGQVFPPVGDEWTPLALFQSGEQGAWYDPSDLTTLYQDAAGTIPVTADGDPVGRMEDKSGNGNHATQPVSASRPVYRTDGALHWLEYDGVDDFLSAGDVLDILNENMVQCAGYNGTTPCIAGKSVAAAVDGRYYLASADNTSILDLFSGYNVAYTLPQSELLVITQRVRRTSTGIHEVRKDGLIVGSNGPINADFSFNTTAPYWIGAYPAADGVDRFFEMDGNLYGLVVHRLPTELSDEVISILESYMAKKTGVTL